MAKSNVSSIMMSIRIQGKGTSVSLRKNIVSLWLLLLEKDDNKWFSHLNDFIYTCADEWCNKGHESAKGFSDFVSRKMIQSVLDEKDYKSYLRIYKNLSN